jgi:hypothetical protein
MRRRLFRACALAFVIAGGAGGQTPTVEPLPAYRARLLGVYNAQTGDPIAGAEVIDLFSKTKALTTATGTVTLAFLPEGGSMLRVQKIGFEPFTQIVPISPGDTAPAMILLRPVATTLPTVVTKDSAPAYIAPGLRGFEERRKEGRGGYFVTEAELRKNDTKTMTYMVRRLPGMQIDCPRGPSLQNACYAYASRQKSKYAFLGGQCQMDVYVDGIVSSDKNLELLRVDQFAAVEYYAGAATIPMQYNKTGSACGVLLFWSRDR